MPGIGIDAATRRMRAARRLAAAGVLACLASPAPAGVVDIAWDGGDRYDGALRAEPKSFVELCGPVAAGTRIDWSFEASAATDFNVHFHEGKRVEYPARQAAVSEGSGTLDAPTAQDYCWMWANKATRPVTVRVRLHRHR
jgi:hypothetical protein